MKVTDSTFELTKTGAVENGFAVVDGFGADDDAAGFGVDAVVDATGVVDAGVVTPAADASGP